MIENIPESLKDKLKDVDLSKLEQCILDAKEMAKEDLTGNTMLRERIPLLIKMVRRVKTEVARTSIECRPERFDVDRAEWYEPFDDIQKALDYAEYQIRIKLREHG